MIFTRHQTIFSEELFTFLVIAPKYLLEVLRFLSAKLNHPSTDSRENGNHYFVVPKNPYSFIWWFIQFVIGFTVLYFVAVP